MAGECHCVTSRPPLLTPDELMARIGGYTSREAFMRAARKLGIPRVRINGRVTRYDPVAVDAWMRRRTT